MTVRMAAVEELATDVLVIGAGMSGLSAAASVARAGGRVVILEAAEAFGGSAAISGGYVWTAATLAEMREENPLGEAHLARLVVDGYEDAVEWLSDVGMDIGPRLPMYMGRGHQIDIRQYLRRCATIATGSGDLLTRVQVRSLVVEDGAVVGVDFEQPDGAGRIRARHTILATGGFQANPELRARYIHPNAAGILLRSNPYSRGDGLRLGLAAGGTKSKFMSGFYGHLIGSPVDRWEERDFGPLSQYLSEFCILVNVNGERFTDESGHDPLNTQAVVRQPGARAWMVTDERIRQEYLGKPHMPGLAWIDRIETATEAGARYARADTIEELSTALAGWGVHRETFLRTVDGYNSGVLLRDEPPRRRAHLPLRYPPFHALEVQPAITFTHGGLRVDPYARVLDAHGAPVPGLLAVGFDAGGVYHKAYAGGLAIALTLGRRAAKTVTEQVPVPIP